MFVRAAEYGTFRHEFFYRQLVKPPSVSKPFRVEEPKPEEGGLSSTHRHSSRIGSSDASKGYTGISCRGWSSLPRDQRQPAIIDLSCSSSQDDGKIEAVGSSQSLLTAAESRVSLSQGAVANPLPPGVFSPQPLLPGAREVVRRAHDALLMVESDGVSAQAPVEGMGGGTVGNDSRGLGSAS